LYAMDRGGSVPEPLIPPDIALQHPAHLDGETPCVLPEMGQILLMIDRDGDENYQPHLVPIEGGTPRPLFGDRFARQQLFCAECDVERHVAIFTLDPRTNPNYETFLADLANGEITSFGMSLYGNFLVDADEAYSKVVLGDMYSFGDMSLYLWERETGERRLLYGKPLSERAAGEQVPLLGIRAGHITPQARGLFMVTSLFEDNYGLGYFTLANPQDARRVAVAGTVHDGMGELTYFKHLAENRYLLYYNIDGTSYVYEGHFDEAALRFEISSELVGTGRLRNGVLESLDYDKESGDYVLSFSTATEPSQIYTIEGKERQVRRHTNERVLGIPRGILAPGEDASYTSHDGLRISARLYLPSPELGYAEPHPVIYYVHGGPQSQERPDFTWFSMPLIQFFTLNGFAVFVPNVRGSQGYGIAYMKQIDHDWGGQDRLDHIAAVETLRADPRLDTSRLGVMGRSYGGYMTLTLAGRHPDLWRAACDMFGPYNLLTFMARIPETWKTYFYHAVGHPEKDK
ncbi:MAG: alpha/beta hydrolase family protein, partial [Ardenticatenaceae bacterium]